MVNTVPGDETPQLFYTVSEVAKLLRMSGNSVRKLYRAGILTGARGHGEHSHIRIAVRSVDRYLESAGAREQPAA